MRLEPFKSVRGIPRFEAPEGYARASSDFSDVMFDYEFIDIAKFFILKIVRGIRESYSVGLTAYIFNGRLSFGFDHEYKICDISFAQPFDIGGENSLFFSNINLFQPTLREAKEILEDAGIKTQLIDVGFEAPEIGVSFFSDDYEKDLNVRLDAVTVHFNRPE